MMPALQSCGAAGHLYGVRGRGNSAGKAAAGPGTGRLESHRESIDARMSSRSAPPRERLQKAP